jgi:predicted SnoaL-like aldol condensation-catalyzing enzyme
MKKLLFLSGLFCLAVLAGCNDKSSGPSPAAQRNLDTEKGIRDAIANKELNKLGDYIANDCIDHSGDHGDIKGLDSIKAQIQVWLAMTDGKTEIVKELADDDYVMSWQHSTGKYKTTGYGHKPGDPFDLQEMEVVRFKDGKAVEHWSMMPPADVMTMMATTAAPVTMDNAILHTDTVQMQQKKKK